jgi:tetratricopeptide (TPR) repeat protein
MEISSKTFYHYTDETGHDALTSGNALWRPSLGFRASSLRNAGRRPVKGLEALFPPEDFADKESLSALLSTSAAFASMIPFTKEFMAEHTHVPGEFVLSDIHYGPGWYVTSLPPSTPTSVLLRELWRGKIENSQKTSFWLEISADSERVEFPDRNRPDVAFLPILNSRSMSGDPPRPVGSSSSPILLVRSGSRQEDSSGNVHVNILFEPTNALTLVDRFTYVFDGFWRLPEERQARLKLYFGLTDAADKKLSEWRAAAEADLINRTHQFFIEGRLKEALATANEALIRNPQSADSLSNKGAILAATDEREEALAFYDQALAVRPEYEKALTNKAATLIRLNRPEDAFTCCDRALSLNSANIEALINKAAALALLKREDEALGCLEEVLRLKPDVREAWDNRGLILLAKSLHAVSKASSPAPHVFRHLPVALDSFLAACNVDAGFTKARRNLRAAFEAALEALPWSFQSERAIWKTAAFDTWALDKLMSMLFVDCRFELHPRYLDELKNGGLGLSLRRASDPSGLIGEVVESLFQHDFSPAFLRARTDDPLRLGFHVMNDALIKAGLLEIPVATAEALSAPAGSLGETLQIAKSLNDSGIGYRRLGEWQSALHCYELAKPLYLSAGDRKFCAHVHFNEGAVYELRREAGDQELAKISYEHALTVYTQLGLRDDAEAARTRLKRITNRRK